MDFRPLELSERRRLAEALRANADDGSVILTCPRTTSFLGTTEEVTDAEVIEAIQSIPVHYGF